MIALLIAGLLALPQDPRVEATLSARSIRVGEAVVYQIIVDSREAAPGRVGTPEMPDAFDILRTQDFSETQLAFPGGRSRRFRREVVLLAQRPGNYTIPSTQVEIGGRVYHTPELQLAVTGTPMRSDAPGRPRFRVEFVPDTVFVGQQALLRAEALIPDGRRPRRARAPTFEPPQTGGFWAQDLPQTRQASIRLIGPDVFEVHSFQRAYFPLAAGRRVLEPATVLYEVRLDWLSGTRVERMTSDSLAITVLPLPDEDRPPSFGGAVGKFTLNALLDRSQVRAGEAATLLVEIRGEGNIKGLPAPSLPEVDGADLLPAGDESESWVSDGVLHGSRTFRWMVVPAGGSRLEVPAIEYAFFDPFERRYFLLRTDPLELEVDATTVTAAADGARGVAPILTLRDSTASDRLAWVRSPWFALLNAAPLLAFAIVAATRRARRPTRGRTRASAMRAWNVRSRARELTADGLRNALLRTLADALELRTVEVASSASLTRALAEHGVDGATIADASALLRRLDEIRYAAGGWSAEVRAELTAAAGDLVRRVCEHVAGDAAPSRAGAGKALAICALVFGLAAAPAAAQPADFVAGVEAYGAEDFRLAAQHFAAHLAAAPQDANGWINLGLAREAEGDTGAALAAYLRAVRYQPRDAELRARIEAIGARRALLHVTPPLRLNTSEATLLGSLLWLGMLAGLFALLMRRDSRAAKSVAILAGALLALHGAMTLLHQRTARTAVVAIAAPTVIRSGPALRAEDRDSVPAGTLLRIRERRGDWLRVAGAGPEGWVERRDLTRP
jgi:tetratricopeptide (TPR) repeat protein